MEAMQPRPNDSPPAPSWPGSGGLAAKLIGPECRLPGEPVSGFWPHHDVVCDTADTLGFSDDLQHLITFAAALCTTDDIDVVQYRAPEVIHRGHAEVREQLAFDLGLNPNVVDPLVDALLAAAIVALGQFAAAVAGRDRDQLNEVV